MLRTTIVILLSLFLSSIAFAQQPPVSEARKAELNDMYQKARALQDESRYADALPLFQQVATELNSPTALLEAGRCLHKMGRHVEAYETMTATVSLATERAQTESRYEPTIQAAKDELPEIEKHVGRLTVSVPTPPSSTLAVNGKQSTPGKLIVLQPGTVRVDVRADGYTSVHQDVNVPPGSHKEVVIQLVPLSAPPPPGPRAAPPIPGPTTPAPVMVKRGGGARIAGFVILGAGVAGWVATIVGGVVSDNKFADVESRCGNGPCTTEADQDIIDEGRTYELAANIGIAVGAAGTIAGTLLIIFGGPTEEPAAPPPITAIAYPGGGFLAYTGSF